MGDSQFWRRLEELHQGPKPLIRIEGPSTLPKFGYEPSKDSFDRWTVTITKAGEAVLAGAQDQIRTNGIDRWVGGVHLSGNDKIWRWDEARNTLSYQ